MTQPQGKLCGWNEVNPASEKPKFGRGTAKGEMKPGAGTQVQINGCHAKADRTWLMIVCIVRGRKLPLLLSRGISLLYVL